MPPIVRRDGPSDKTLVRRARQGDRQAFLTLLHRYDPRLRRLAVRLLADPKRLDRVLARAYLKAWRSLPFLKRGEPAAGWLYRIVYNTCINEMRWEPTRRPPPAPDGPPVPLPAAPAEQRLLALRALAAAERVPLVLVDGEGFSLDAAAKMMRRDSADVAADLTRARGRWRTFVNGDPEPLPDQTQPAVVIEYPDDDGNQPARRAPAPPTRASLATLAMPTAEREPGGHVKLLTQGAGRTPVVAAKKVIFTRQEPVEEEAANGAGSRHRASAAGETPAAGETTVAGEATVAESGVELTNDETEPVPAPSSPVPARQGQPPLDDHDRDNAGPHQPRSNAGAGARRKRRRDAKRAVRARGRAAPGAGSNGSGTDTAQPATSTKPKGEAPVPDRDQSS